MKTHPDPDYSCIISEPPATQLQSQIVTLHFEIITVQNFAISPDGSETPGTIKFTLPPKLTKITSQPFSHLPDCDCLDINPEGIAKPCNCHPYQNQTP